MIQTCSKCLTVNYCSREHQIEHWNIHKDWCEQTSQNRAIEATNFAAQYSQPDCDSISLTDFDLSTFDCETLSNFVSSLDNSTVEHFVPTSQQSQLQQAQQTDNFMANSGVFVTLPQPEQVCLFFSKRDQTLT